MNPLRVMAGIFLVFAIGIWAFIIICEVVLNKVDAATRASVAGIEFRLLAVAAEATLIAIACGLLST